MENWQRLIELASRVVLVKITIFFGPYFSAAEELASHLWGRCILSVLILGLILKTAEGLVYFYSVHNFVHRKITKSSFIDAEYYLWKKNLLENQTSLGFLENTKFFMSRLLRYNRDELIILYRLLENRNELHHRVRILYWLCSMLFALLSGWFSGVIPLNTLPASNMHLFLFSLLILFWLLAMEYRWVNHKKQTLSQLFAIHKAIMKQNDDFLVKKEISKEFMDNTVSDYFLDTQG